MSMERIRLNGVELNVQCMGRGPLLVMCHGLVFGSVATWYFTAAHRLAQRFRVVLYDLRGHGKSELTATGYDLSTQAQDLAALIDYLQRHDDQLSSGPVYLAGHSYGGLIALHYSLQQPAQIAKLALVDAPLPANRYIYPSMAEVTTEAALARCYPPELIARLASGARAATRLQARVRSLFLQSSLRQDVAAAGDVAEDRLQTLTCPVLCLYGQHSDCLAAGERLAQVLPQACLQLLDCGHFIPVEASEAMTQHLDAFL